MNFPPQTPAAVRTAVTAYADRHKFVTIYTLAGFSIGTIWLITLAYLLADRFVEMPVLLRATGMLLVLAANAIFLPLILRAMLRRESPRAIAIRLDAALPQNQDRWATALELTSPAAPNTTPPASPELVARLLRDTDAATTPAAATSVVPTQTLKLGAMFFALVLAGLALVATNSHFNFRLLMQRFFSPWANLPRDSTTQVHFLNVNQHTPQNGYLPEAAWRILENDVFALSIALSRRNQTTTTTAAAPDPTPRLEILRPDGRLISQDFLRAGRAWTFSLGALTDDVTFRIRAGDALTETFRVAVQPRIRITTVRHTVRFPGYARLAEIKTQPLKGDRLSLLEDAQIDFEVDCDQPIRELVASFELLDKSRGDDAPAAKSAREAVAAQRQAGTTGQPAEKKSEAPRTRTLPVKIRQNNQATLRLKLDQPGLLRLRVIGENGLTGVERVIVIEPIRDTAPRLTVSGLEPDTYIVPGETLAFQYAVEDDLGVSDIIMDWAVAGSARTGNLAGEEPLATPAAGQKQLTGQRLLQRMNYYVYGGSPMEITLIAVDSKGQEVRSPTFRIFLESDSFATRFANGLTFLRSVQAQANQHAGHVGGLFNQTKILEAAAGTSRTWPAAQSNLLARFLEQSATRPAPAQQLYVEQYHGGWPQRLLESTALALSLRRALVGHPDVPATGPRLRDTSDLPATLVETRAILTNQVRLASLWRAAIDAESRRFAPETLLQKLRGIRLRLARSEAQTQKANLEVQKANLEFYQNETKAIITNARGLDPLVAARFTNDVAALETALATKESAPLLQRLTQFERALAAFAPPASDELQTAVAEIAQHARTSAPAKRQFLHALADLLTLRESEAGTAPLDDLKLCRAWLTDTVPAPAALLTAPAEPLDLWLLTERLLRDWRTLLLDVELRRFALQPDQQDDTEAGLREQALALADRLARGTNTATTPAPALAESLRAVLQPALTSDFAGPTGRAHADRLAAVARQLEPVARQQLTALQPQFTQDLALVGKKLLALADAYDAHAAAVDAAYAEFQRQPDLAGKQAAFFARFPIEAEELQSAPRLLEMTFRIVQFLRTAVGTEASADWARSEPWHLLELLFMVNGQGGYDKVVYRYDTRYNIRTVQGYTTVGPVVRGFAAQLRLQAGLLQRAVAGQPLDFDFPRFLIENKLSGIPERTKAEFQLASPLLAKPDATARAAALAELKKSPNAALLAKESATQRALAQAAQFAAAALATPATLLPALKSLHSTLADDTGKSPVAELNDALAELEALPAAQRTAALSPLWQGRVTALRTAVESELNSRCTALRLPPVSTVSSVNRRDQTAVAKIFWTIRTGMDNFDRRWTTRMRDTELMWLRKVHHAAAAAAPASASAADEAARADLALTTAVLGELRARQFGRESRANKGINLLPEDTGPSLNLPPHIAQEFLRARTARPPTAFADRTETYFQKLFNDLKR